jgi:hypothetical protein
VKDPHDLGTAVRQAVKPVKGIVTDVKYEPALRTMQYLVEWDGGSRWFNEADIEVDPDASSTETVSLGADDVGNLSAVIDVKGA